jgi:hypothetical protein
MKNRWDNYTEGMEVEMNQTEPNRIEPKSLLKPFCGWQEARRGEARRGDEMGWSGFERGPTSLLGWVGNAAACYAICVCSAYMREGEGEGEGEREKRARAHTCKLPVGLETTYL